MKTELRNKFRKIASIATSVLLVGSTIGFAIASIPSPFIKENVADYAVVTGVSAATTDFDGANSINAYLKTFYSDTTNTNNGVVSGDFSESSGVSEDIVLGSSITSKIRENLLDNKIPSLLDTDFSWNDGNGVDMYDFHEEVNILNHGIKVKTTLDDSNLNSSVVLENNKALEYKFVFDDELDKEKIGNGDSDNLYLNILGKEYEVTKMEQESVTISFSEEKIVKPGDTISVSDKVITIGDIFEKTIEIDGNLVREGKTKTINGIEVFVDTIAYHSTAGSPSKAILKFGTDISKKIVDEDEYIQGDESWIWTIENPGEVGGYIGIKYDMNNVGYDEDEPEENAIVQGQSYVFPENYASIIFNGLTSVVYDDFELLFDDRDIYTDKTTKKDNVDVAIIKGKHDDSIEFNLPGVGRVETDSIYLRYINKTGEGEDEIPAKVEMYFKDINGDVDNEKEGRIQFVYTYEGNVEDIAKLVVDDTELNLGMDITDSGATISFINSNYDETLSVELGVENGKFVKLGDKEEDAESEEISIGETNIGTREDDVLSHYGLIIQKPESNADNDIVSFSVPSEQVFANIKVVGQGKEVETNVTTVVPTYGGVAIRDSEIASGANKNLVIVGGSCINTEAARLLGGSYCGSEFTSKTGIGKGHYMIEVFASPYNANKIAVLIAGYDKEDTARGVSDFLQGNIDLSVGYKKVV